MMEKLTFYRRAVLLLSLLLLNLPVLVNAQEVQPTASVDTNSPVATMNPLPRPAPTSVITVEGMTLELYFQQVKQGRAALMRVTGSDIAGARLRFLDRVVDFFPVADDGFYGLLAVSMDQSPRIYDFTVLAWDAAGTSVTIPAQVEIVLGGFIRQDVNVTPDKAYLIDPQVERNEFARLNAVVNTYTPEKLWGDDGFQYPIASEITSQFGAFRVFNQTVETRHTGWDLRAATGTPVSATASGVVAYAGLLDIRGNHVIIDHGYGIFSTYSHLSQIHVTRGQTVTRGQIIGVSGNTGRSGGAHFHWEIVVNGEWVDSVDFQAMWMP